MHQTAPASQPINAPEERIEKQATAISVLANFCHDFAEPLELDPRGLMVAADGAYQPAAKGDAPAQVSHFLRLTVPEATRQVIAANLTDELDHKFAGVMKDPLTFNIFDDGKDAMVVEIPASLLAADAPVETFDTVVKQLRPALARSAIKGTATWLCAAIKGLAEHAKVVERKPDPHREFVNAMRAQIGAPLLTVATSPAI